MPDDIVESMKNTLLSRTPITNTPARGTNNKYQHYYWLSFINHYWWKGDDLRDHFLALTRNQNYPPSMVPEDGSPPTPPPPINTKRNVEGYYEYNDDAAFD